MGVSGGVGECECGGRNHFGSSDMAQTLAPQCVCMLGPPSLLVVALTTSREQEAVESGAAHADADALPMQSPVTHSDAAAARHKPAPPSLAAAHLGDRAWEILLVQAQAYRLHAEAYLMPDAGEDQRSHVAWLAPPDLRLD